METVAQRPRITDFGLVKRLDGVSDLPLLALQFSVLCNWVRRPALRRWEVVANYTQYRIAHPKHGRLSRKAFIHDLQLSPTAEAWLNLNSVEYRPFASNDPTNQLAIVVYPSPGSGSGDKIIVFTIGDLIAR